MKTIFLLLLSLFAFEGLNATHAQQGLCCGPIREFESPEAFEKIYVKGCSIVSMPDGTYYRHPCGQLEKIRTLSHDCKGMYFLRVYVQCPLCGCVYSGTSSGEGMSCPLYEQETFPGIWE